MEVNLLEDSPKALFFRYLIPSVCATMVTSIYVLADSIMIGKGLGELAIAALNLLLPLFNVLFGTGALFGVGGAVLFSVAIGNNNLPKARRYFSCALALNLLALLGYLLGGTLYFDQLLALLGATEATLPYAVPYARCMLLGVPFFMMNIFLQAFVRNDQNPRLAMAAVIAGGVLNIVLDWLFIYPLDFGMTGASAATAMGSATTCLILCTHFFRKDNHLSLQGLVPHWQDCRDIFQYGFSSFFMEICGGVVIFVLNLQMLRYAGELGVTVYSILSNSSYMVLSLSNGVAQAAQPLLAVNYGAGLHRRIRQLQRYGLSTAAIVGLTFVAVGLLAPALVIQSFIHPTAEIMTLAPQAVRLYFLSFFAMALNIFFITCFQSTLQPARALVLCVLRGLVLCIAFAYTLPLVLDVTGLWLTMPLAESLTLLVALVLQRRKS